MKLTYGVTRQEFNKLTRPILSWAMNCKNPLFKTVTTSFTNDPKDHDNPSMDVTVFYSGNNRLDDVNNTLFTLYSFYDREEITVRKGLLQRALKAKTFAEFAQIRTLFKGYIRQ